MKPKRPYNIAERIALLLWMIEKMRSAPGLSREAYFTQTGRAVRSFRRDIATIQAAGYTYRYDHECCSYRITGFDSHAIDAIAA